MGWFLKAVKNYAGFSGRAQRSEYWFFILFYFIITVVLVLVDGAVGGLDYDSGLGLFSGIFMLAMLIPSLAVSIRRLHDTDRTGWWMLINLLPLIGGLIFLVFTVMDSTPGDNQYGPSPKEEQ
jgi:uncharacterized membrane protein YhaH (DUF805 family)